MECEKCSNNYPDEFFVAGGMCVNGHYYNVCPNCAKEIMGRPFTKGTYARDLYDKFNKYLYVEHKINDSYKLA